MAVGKGSMARASKAVKKTTEQAEEIKQPEVVELKEKKKEVSSPKKQTVKKKEKVEEIQENTLSNKMVAIGDEMPVYYL